MNKTYGSRCTPSSKTARQANRQYAIIPCSKVDGVVWKGKCVSNLQSNGRIIIESILTKWKSDGNVWRTIADKIRVFHPGYHLTYTQHSNIIVSGLWVELGMRINSYDRCCNTAIWRHHNVQISSNDTHKEWINQLVLVIEYTTAWCEYVGWIDYNTIAVVQWGCWGLNWYDRWKSAGYSQISASDEWHCYIDVVIAQFGWRVMWGRGYRIINKWAPRESVMRQLFKIDLPATARTANIADGRSIVQIQLCLLFRQNPFSM